MSRRWSFVNRAIVLAALARGYSQAEAARLIGAHKATISKWLKRGEESPAGSQYRQFAEDVAAVRAGEKVRSLDRAEETPEWAAAYLEAGDPAFAPAHERRSAPPELVTADEPIVIQLEFGPHLRPVKPPPDDNGAA